MLHFRRHVADREGERAVRVVLLYDTPEIQPHDVAFLDAPVRGRDAVNDFLVDRDTHGRREAAIALEGGLRPARGDEALDVLVDLQRRHAWLHRLAQPIHDIRENVAAAAHETDLAGGLQLDHAAAPCAALRTARWMSSIAPSPRTEASRLRARYQSSSGAVCRA